VSYLKKGLLGVGAVVASLSLLTACQTIKGTLQGADRDVNNGAVAVEKATSPAKPAAHHKKAMHHKAAHHKKAMHKKAMPEANTDVTIGS